MRETLYKRGKELKAAYERIEELAQLDELTGALNRRFVMKELDEELMRCMRSHQPCSISTGSRRSTTRSDIRPATKRCEPSQSPCSPTSAASTSSAAMAARNFCW